jgi:hypothetical protein
MIAISRRNAFRAAGAAGTMGLSSFVRAASGAENPVLGKWTYRSFINDPDPNTDFNKLRFAVAELSFEEAEFGKIAGSLNFGNDSLKLTGTITFGNPFTVRFQGVGSSAGTIENGQPWVYDYLGFVAPAWPNGINQTSAIVGTVVRTVTHSNGQAKAGFVASWIGVQSALPKAK